MFEAKLEKTPNNPKYCKIGPYIVSLDYIHGVMSVKTENKDFPFQIYITYTDKSSVCLECPNKEEKDKAMERIASELGAV